MCVSGPPYDTLEEVIGTRGPHGQGSLSEFGVRFRCLDFPFTDTRNVDADTLEQDLHRSTTPRFLLPEHVYQEAPKGYTVQWFCRASESLSYSKILWL